MSTIDKETFSTLIKEYTPNMYRLALSMLHSQQDAEDAVSGAVLKAYENLYTLRNVDRFKSWIMQITANEARKIYRNYKRTACVEIMEDFLPAFEDERHELWDVVQKMDLNYREVIILYYYEQLSLKEISKVLHIPVGTVKSRLSRGKKLLRDML